jgi:hypothetical protein
MSAVATVAVGAVSAVFAVAVGAVSAVATVAVFTTGAVVTAPVGAEGAILTAASTDRPTLHLSMSTYSACWRYEHYTEKHIVNKINGYIYPECSSVVCSIP